MMREGRRPPLRAKTAGHLSGRDRPPRWPAWETYSLRRNEAYRPSREGDAEKAKAPADAAPAAGAFKRPRFARPLIKRPPASQGDATGRALPSP